MRMTTEPTKHVLNLVEFAESVIARVAAMGLMPRRHYKRRKRKEKVTNNPGPKVKGKTRKKKVHPLEQTEEV